MSSAFLVCAAITAISALISLGYSLAAALNSAGEAKILARYACARSVALALASAGPFVTGSVPWLLAVASSMTVVQALDAGIGVTIQDRMKTWGPAGTALANLVSVIWLLNS